MKIAIPLFDKRISPRFDCAQGFLLASTENGRVLKREVFSAPLWSPPEIVKKLREMGVDTVICGGIDEVSSRQLILQDMKTYSWVTGLAEDALQSLLTGGLESCTMVGPGGQRRGTWRFKRHEADVGCETGGRGKGRGRGGGRGGKRGGRQGGCQGDGLGLEDRRRP